MSLEIIVTSVDEALDAQRGGASRVELVRDFARGGLTPDDRVIESVANALRIPVHVMLRPHDRGFVYDSAEREQILSDASRMRELGASALVFGALDARGDVDVVLAEAVHSAAGLPMTFHRAFDEARDLRAAYLALAQVPSVKHVLTSGGAPTAWDGRERLRELSALGANPTVLAGAGIDAENVVQLIAFCGVREIHIGNGARTNGRLDVHKIEKLVRLLRPSTGSG